MLLRLQSIAPGSTFDADEAVTGVMARRILLGQNQYVYFTAQDYNGSLEQYVQAAMYAVFHLPETPFTLRLPQVAFGVTVTVVVYLLARHIVPSRWPAVAAAAYFAAGPYFNIWVGTRSYGAYDSRQLVGVLGVLFALRATGWAWNGHRVEAGQWAVALWLGLFGLALGLTVWLGLPGFEILAAAAVWLLPSLIRSWRGFLLGLGGLFVGGSPVLVWIYANGRLPDSQGPQPVTTLVERAQSLWRIVMRQYLGLSGPPEIQRIVLILLVAVFVAAFVVRIRGMLGILTLRLAPRHSGDLILAIIPVTVLIYVVSSYTWYTATPRYLNVLYPITAVAFGMLIQWIAMLPLPRDDRSSLVLAWVAAVVAVGFVALTALTAFHTERTATAASSQVLTSDTTMQKAEAYLEAHHYDAVYAEYWTALPAQYFDTDEKIAFAPLRNGYTRGDADNPLVAASPTFVYMASLRAGIDSAPTIRAALNAHGVTYREVQIGSITLFVDLSEPLRPADLGLVTF